MHKNHIEPFSPPTYSIANVIRISNFISTYYETYCDEPKMNDKSLKCHWFVRFNQSACLLVMWQIKFFFVSSPLCVSTASSVICHIACTIQQNREEKTHQQWQIYTCATKTWNDKLKKKKKRVVNTMGFVCSACSCEWECALTCYIYRIQWKMRQQIRYVFLMWHKHVSTPK